MKTPMFSGEDSNVLTSTLQGSFSNDKGCILLSCKIKKLSVGIEVFQLSPKKVASSKVGCRIGDKSMPSDMEFSGVGYIYFV
jgi:hypothetical protein